MNTYAELETLLVAKGIGSYHQGPDRLVISNANPALPGSNCFWVTIKAGRWYIGTWLPAVYQVPVDVEISGVCEAVFGSSTQAIYTIDRALADRLGLKRLSVQDLEELALGT